jgi:hypothetical protein
MPFTVSQGRASLMGMYALIEDTRQNDLAQAVKAANEWQSVGRPIILASLAILRADDELTPLFEHRRRDYREAHDAIEAAQTTLLEMLEGIRDDFLCDQRKSWNKSLSDEEAEAADAFNDELNDAVVSVRDLEKIVEREDYNAYIRGARR